MSEKGAIKNGHGECLIESLRGAERSNEVRGETTNGFSDPSRPTKRNAEHTRQRLQAGTRKRRLQPWGGHISMDFVRTVPDLDCAAHGIKAEVFLRVHRSTFRSKPGRSLLEVNFVLFHLRSNC